MNPKDILNVGAVKLERVLDFEPEFLDAEQEISAWRHRIVCSHEEGGASEQRTSRMMYQRSHTQQWRQSIPLQRNHCGQGQRT